MDLKILNKNNPHKFGLNMSYKNSFLRFGREN